MSNSTYFTFDPGGAPVSAANPLPVTTAAANVTTNAPIPGGAATATNATVVGGEYRSTLTTLTTTQQGPLQTDARGNLRVFLTAQSIVGADGVSNAAIVGLSTSGEAAAAASRPVVVGNFVFNATSWDRQRGDANGTAASPHAIASSRWQYPGVTGGLTDTTDTTVIAAGGASVRNYMTAIQYCNTSAVASEIVVKDGSTVIWRGMAPASMLAMASISFDAPLRSTANAALNVAMITTATATRISAQGYQGV